MLPVADKLMKNMMISQGLSMPDTISLEHILQLRNEIEANNGRIIDMRKTYFEQTIIASLTLSGDSNDSELSEEQN